MVSIPSFNKDTLVAAGASSLPTGTSSLVAATLASTHGATPSTPEEDAARITRIRVLSILSSLFALVSLTLSVLNYGIAGLWTTPFLVLATIIYTHRLRGQLSALFGSAESTSPNGASEANPLPLPTEATALLAHAQTVAASRGALSLPTLVRALYVLAISWGVNAILVAAVIVYFVVKGGGAEWSFLGENWVWIATAECVSAVVQGSLLGYLVVLSGQEVAKRVQGLAVV